MAIRVPTPLAVCATIGVAGAIGIASLWLSGWTQEGALTAARLTARFSFPLFLLAWSASALARLWPGGWRSLLLRRRRAVGLSFAGAHAVHLVALVSAIVLFGDEASLVSIVGGGLGYVFVAAMALTSNDAAVRAMGPPNWRLLHTVGSYLIAGIFAFSYFGRLEDKPVLAVTALSLLAMTAALKAAAWIKFRMPRRATR